ncbi:MAG: radical SAM protein [Clostridia bacterium]|nr:radical SAM protein [Clostridia bacterium]
MKEPFNIQKYMSRGVAKVVAGSLIATATNKKEAAYMRFFARSAFRASKKRAAAEKAGEHIPPFLIASITGRCNLHCAGCYSRANHTCGDREPEQLMRAEEWDHIFAEAKELGISYILLAGGEPMLRYDVLNAAAKYPDILFPIFTNGTCLNDRYLALLNEHRNLLPVISIEGGKDATDARRGTGVYDKVTEAMWRLKQNGMVFGTSVTVTKDNMHEVCSDGFAGELYEKGCRVIIFVEYVPADGESEHLAPGEPEQAWIQRQVRALRRKNRRMVLISFPGDEKSSDGCVAAGRGFFHINAHGGAEPCPFSPYSDCNVRDSSIREALRSPLFYALNAQGLLKDDHIGGCTLYANRERVEQLINQS